MAHSQDISDVLVEFARTLVREHDVERVLSRFMNRVVDVLDVWGAGVSLADETGRLRFVLATDEVLSTLQALEDDMEKGPCRESYDTGVPIVVGDLGAVGGRWPRLVSSARSAGVHAVMGVPMTAHGERVGALNVYDTEQRQFGDDQIAKAQILADVATGYIVNVRDLNRARALADQLQTALDSRVLIEQAKGYLAARLGVDVSMAFEILRRYSRSNGEKLHKVAADVIDGTLMIDKGTLRQADNL